MSASSAPESMAPPAKGVIDRARFSALAKRVGIDAVVLSTPSNVYYATGAMSVLSRFSQRNTLAVVVPADLNRPIVLIADGIEFYNELAVGGLVDGVEVVLTGKNLTQPKAAEEFLWPSCGPMPFDAREERRRQATVSYGPFLPGFQAALAKVFEQGGLSRGTIGFDALDAMRWSQSAAPHAVVRAADDFMLHVRLVKTAAEIALLRQSCQANAQAAVATIAAVRECQGIRELRQRYFEEAARCGNVGVYGNIDMVVNEMADGPLEEGHGFMVDFVSHHGNYQSDLARTVFLGEPPPSLRRAAEVGLQAWHEIRSKLKPGLRFSEIRQLGVDTVNRMNEPFLYAFSSHSVGLQHWDHPQYTLEGAPLDNVLEAGMVLSVDCPLLGPGVWGSTHYEDLVVITADAYQLLHEEVPPYFTV